MSESWKQFYSTRVSSHCRYHANFCPRIAHSSHIFSSKIEDQREHDFNWQTLNAGQPSIGCLWAVDSRSSVSRFQSDWWVSFIWDSQSAQIFHGLPERQLLESHPTFEAPWMEKLQNREGAQSRLLKRYSVLATKHLECSRFITDSDKIICNQSFWSRRNYRVRGAEITIQLWWGRRRMSLDKTVFDSLISFLALI